MLSKCVIDSFFFSMLKQEFINLHFAGTLGSEGNFWKEKSRNFLRRNSCIPVIPQFNLFFEMNLQILGRNRNINFLGLANMGNLARCEALGEISKFLRVRENFKHSRPKHFFLNLGFP